MKQDISKYVGQQIKKFRKQKGLTQRELGLKVGVKHNTISSYENGTNEAEQDMMFLIAQALDISINDLFPSIDDNHFTKEELPASDFALLPIYGQISCGNGKLTFDDPVGHEKVPKEWLNGGEYFMLVAQGDSMTGSRIYEGDKLLMRRQEEIENGEIAAVVVEDQTLLKKVSRQGNMLVLESSNDKYPTKFYDLEKEPNVKIVGKLKKLIVSF